MFFTSFDDTYTIDVDSVTGVHGVGIDPKYKYEPVEHQGSLRDTRSVDVTLSEPTNTSETEKTYVYETQHAVDFNSFITLLHPDTFLLIKGVKDRSCDNST